LEKLHYSAAIKAASHDATGSRRLGMQKKGTIWVPTADLIDPTSPVPRAAGTSFLPNVISVVKEE
jgi:hypothetical protein